MSGTFPLWQGQQVLKVLPAVLPRAATHRPSVARSLLSHARLTHTGSQWLAHSTPVGSLQIVPGIGVYLSCTGFSELRYKRGRNTVTGTQSIPPAFALS